MQLMVPKQVMLFSKKTAANGAKSNVNICFAFVILNCTDTF